MKKIIKNLTLVLTVLAVVITCICPVMAADLTQSAATKTTLSISWEKPSDETNCAGYYIGYGETPEAAKAMIDNKKIYKDGLGFTSHVLKNLKPGTRYYVDIAFKSITGAYNEIYIRDAQVYTKPGKVTGLKVVEANYFHETADVEWDTQSGASGYEYVLKDNSGKTISEDRITAGMSSNVNIVIKNNTFMTLKVRAYENHDGVMVYGAWSDTIKFGSQATISKLATPNNNIKITWKKFAGAKNYAVYASKSANGNFKKVATTKKTTATITKIGNVKITKFDDIYVYIIPQNGKLKGQKTMCYKISDGSFTAIDAK